jgi:hypothetical protein
MKKDFEKLLKKIFTQISAILYRNDSIIKKMGNECYNRAVKHTKQNNYLMDAKHDFQINDILLRL